MRLFVVIIYLMALTLSANAIGVDKARLADPAQEARAYNIMTQLRCLVCQNESIAESDASLAQDLRAIVRQQVKAGKTDAEIIHFMTSRYGDWILLKPPLKPTTIVLWFGPLALLLIGGFMVLRYIRQNPETDMEDPLTADEKKRLKKILGGKMPKNKDHLGDYMS